MNVPAVCPRWLALLGLSSIALLGIMPLLAEPPPVAFIEAPSSEVERAARQVAVALLLVGVIACRARSDQRRDPLALRHGLLFVGGAGLMTLCHWFIVDRHAFQAAWQRDLYLCILNDECPAPHQYRWLPYGLTRALEWASGDWDFAVAAYRLFFNYWFLWGWHRFARLFLDGRPALLTFVVLPLYYPLSVMRYWGQLTDPVSHALFVLALIYLVEDRLLLLALTLALGVLAKETVVLLVPVYLAVHGWKAIAWPRAAALGAVCVLAFLAARLPLGWRPSGGESINGVDGLMLATNLGLDRLGIGTTTGTLIPPLWENYAHPLGFVLPFVPFIAWGWSGIDTRLKAIFLTLTPLLLLSNLCWGWLYESRNYVPLLPVLATMALAGVVGQSREPRDSTLASGLDAG